MFERTFKNIDDTLHQYSSCSRELYYPDTVEKQEKFLDELKQFILPKAFNGELR
jgi:hypothetical protein